MWLTNSSVGRKVLMSVTGLFLVLFVTFHALMNAVALISFDAYDAICEFLGANWYAVLGTLILAGGFVIHIIFAFWLTFQNRKARGNNRYAVTTKPKDVEWASQNMLVLGIIVLGVMVLHLTQFWAKMQLQNWLGTEEANPYMLMEAVFGKWWNLCLYLIWFAALWFHLTHGFWSALQTIGWNNQIWFKRWKWICGIYVTIVLLGFALVAIFAFLKANGLCGLTPYTPMLG